MKRLRSSALVFSLVLGAPLLDAASAPVIAQAPEAPAAAPTAAEVASSVNAFYQATRTVRVRFSQHFWNRAYERTQSSRGRMTISRPGRIRFDYDQPQGKVIVSTPAGFVFYEPGENGAAGQFMRGQSEAASAALGILSGTASLERDFTFTLRPATSSQPANTDALELRPRRADPHYRRVVLYVDRRPASRGVVHRVSVEDPDGNWNRFDFSDFHFNESVGDGTFAFDPPAGAREMTAPAATPH